MRVRPLLAAAAAATLALSGVVATALPAQAAECDLDCFVDVTINAPTQIGIGGGWVEFSIDVENPGDAPVEVEEVELVFAGDGDFDSDVTEYNIYLDVRGDDGSWYYVEDVNDDALGFDLETSFDLGAQESHTIDVRVAALDGFVEDAIGDAMAGLDPDSVDLVEALDGVTDVSVDIDLTAVVTGSIEGFNTGVIGVGEATTNAATLDITVEPTDLAFTAGEPASLTVSLTNTSDSNYQSVLLLPIVPGVDLLGGLGGLPGDEITPFSDGSPEDDLALLSELTEDAGTLVEVLVDDEWRELDFVPDENTGDLLLDVPSGTTTSSQWRFTFSDESVLEQPEPTTSPDPSPSVSPSYSPWDEDTTYYGDDIIWIALQINEESEVEDSDYYDLPFLQLLGLESTPASVAVPAPPVDETPVETPTPTTPPAVDVDDVDDAADDDNAAADDDSGVADAGDGNEDTGGTAPTGEVAQTGYDLTGQATLGLLLLVVGGLAVLATVRYRKATVSA